MFKNLYKPDDYTISDRDYKLRAGFLPKRKPADDDIPVEKEDTPEEKEAKLLEELETLESIIQSKQQDIDVLNEQIDSLTGKAESDAAAIMQKAQSDAEELKETKSKEGYEEGYQKGYDDGMEKGKTDAEDKFRNLVNTMQSITEAAKTQRDQVIKDTEGDIVDLSAAIAKKVVLSELETNKKVIVNFVKEAIMKLEEKEKIYIYAHPDDIELIKSHREDFKELVDTTDTLHILPDDMLEQGECRLESKSEIIDTDVNYQFGEIKKKLHSGE